MAPRSNTPVYICGIYTITNTVSGRIYVGSAAKIHKRWLAHRNHLKHGTHHSKSLQRSWIKHGPDAFVFEVVEVVSNSLDLIVREQHWLDKLGSAHPKRGFNIRPNAANQLGTKRSAESRKRMSESARRRDPETHKNRRKSETPPWNKGMKMSPEFCQLIGDIQRGQKRKPRSPETRARIGDANRGNKSHLKGKPRDPEIIRKTVQTKRMKRRVRTGQGELEL
jgi:group I intron endonuclease